MRYRVVQLRAYPKRHIRIAGASQVGQDIEYGSSSGIIGALQAGQQWKTWTRTQNCWAAAVGKDAGV